MHQIEFSLQSKRVSEAKEVCGEYLSPLFCNFCMERSNMLDFLTVFLKFPSIYSSLKTLCLRRCSKLFQFSTIYHQSTNSRFNLFFHPFIRHLIWRHFSNISDSATHNLLPINGENFLLHKTFNGRFSSPSRVFFDCFAVRLRQ